MFSDEDLQEGIINPLADSLRMKMAHVDVQVDHGSLEGRKFERLAVLFTTEVEDFDGSTIDGAHILNRIRLAAQRGLFHAWEQSLSSEGSPEAIGISNQIDIEEEPEAFEAVCGDRPKGKYTWACILYVRFLYVDDKFQVYFVDRKYHNEELEFIEHQFNRPTFNSDDDKPPFFGG